MSFFTPGQKYTTPPATEPLAKKKSKAVHRFQDGDVPVILQQVGADKFTVIYGLQIKRGLSYSEAAQEYGECVFHSLCCAGKIEQRELE